MDLHICLFLALPVLLLFLFQKQKTRRNLNLPPGPRGLPFIGNLLQLNTPTHLYLWDLSIKYGPLMSLRMASQPVLVVSSAETAKQVLKTHDRIFCNRPSFLALLKLSYDGLDMAFSPYGAYWREIRRICMLHLFNSNQVQSFRSIREDEVSSMIQKVTELAMDSKPVNLSEALKSLTISLTCRVGFGMRCAENGIEASAFQELIAESQTLFTKFFISDYFPVLGFIDKLTGAIHRLEKCFKDFDIFYEEIIKEHLDLSRSKPEHEDILDVLLRIRKDSSSKIQLTLNHIKAVLMNVFLAGTEPSGATVVWTMTFLMKNPLTMQKAQQEIRNLVGNKGFVDEDDLKQTSYLKVVIKETLTLQPPTPLLLPRESTENCKLEGYDIPAKTIVHVNAYAIGRDPQLWQNPEEFCPERFIGNSIDLKGHDFELIPFGAGRRICPGIHMGLAAVELSLANLLYKFNWALPDGIQSEDIDIEVQPGITFVSSSSVTLISHPKTCNEEKS